MPTFHRVRTAHFGAETTATLRKTRSEYLKSRITRFIADANIEPWALHVMRYKRLDILSADAAGIRNLDDHAIFGKAWRLKRILVTHDSDLLDDQLFPFNQCGGLLVLPTYGRVSLEFGDLVAEATAVVCRGREMWFHTKIVATRDFVLKIR